MKVIYNTTVILSVITFFSLAMANDSDLKIRSGITKVFDKPIQVNEDDLRRIYAEIDKAKRNLSTPSQIVFHVEREDEKFYETTSIEEVLSDPNVLGSKVHYLRLELRIVDPKLVRDPWEPIWFVKVAFSSTGKYHASIKISHPDKNWSLLLADSLNSQLKRTFHAKRTPSWLIGALLLSVYFLGYKLKSISEKSDVTHLVFNSVYNPMLFGMIMAILFLRWENISGSELYISLFGPESGFLWGDSKGDIIQNEVVRNNIFWVIVIGFPLAIIANITSALIAKKDKKVKVTHDE